MSFCNTCYANKPHFYKEWAKAAASINAVESVSPQLMHDRMGHMDWNAVRRLNMENPPMIGVQLNSEPEPKTVCPGCQAGKGKRNEFKQSSNLNKATAPLERIHADLTGPMQVNSLRGEKYGCVFTDDYSRHVWNFPLKMKSQTLQTFQSFVAMVEKQTGRKIKYFRSDRGGEFLSKEFTKFLEDNGITHKTTAPDTPQQNGTAERMNRTLVGGARAMLQHAGLSNGFWAEAMGAAAHILNRAPRRGLNWRTTYELVFRQVPSITHIKVYGCRAWVYNEH